MPSNQKTAAKQKKKPEPPKLKAGEPRTLEKKRPGPPSKDEEAYRNDLRTLTEQFIDTLPVVDDKSYEHIKKPRGYKAPDTLLLQHTAAKLYQYVQRLVELGASEGGFGKVDISPSVKPINEAFHHVLAGGKVTVILERPGDPTIVDELDTLIEDGYAEANRINKQAGYRITLEL
jgi:hypothetical protein